MIPTIIIANTSAIVTMEQLGLKRTQRLYEELRTQCWKATFHDGRTDRAEALLLDIEKPTASIQQSLNLYSKAANEPSLQGFLLQPLRFSLQDEKILALYEPVEDLMGAYMHKSLRSEQWLEETGLPALLFLTFSLWQVHAAGFIHCCISSQSVFFAKEGLYKIGPSKHFQPKHPIDLQALEDVRDLGNLFIRFLIPNPIEGYQEQEGNTRRRARLSQLQINADLQKLLMDMTNDYVAERIDAKAAFYAIEAMIPPSEPSGTPPPPVLSDLQTLLLDLETVIRSPEVFSPALIKSLLQRISQSYAANGGDISVKITSLVGSCSKCRQARRVQNMVALDCKDWLCLSCAKQQAEEAVFRETSDLYWECTKCGRRSKATADHLNKLRLGSKDLAERLLGRV